MSISIAIATIIPVLFPTPTESSLEGDLTMSMVMPLIEKLSLLTDTINREGGSGNKPQAYGQFNDCMLVSWMLSAELHSMHGPSALPSAYNANSPTKRGSSAHLPLEVPFIPSDSTIVALTAEMENLIIDKQLQPHPLLCGYWDAAVAQQH